MKKINENTNYNDDHTNANDPFAGFTAHDAKIFRKDNRYQDYR